MAYTKDKEWLRDELMLLSAVLSSPTNSTMSASEKVGAYMGTHRAAVIILYGIIDAVKEDSDEHDTL
jgi:hypothetical protein